MRYFYVTNLNTFRFAKNKKGETLFSHDEAMRIADKLGAADIPHEICEYRAN